jgi:stage V sporulation protein SpoVS
MAEGEGDVRLGIWSVFNPRGIKDAKEGLKSVFSTINQGVVGGAAASLVLSRLGKSLFTLENIKITGAIQGVKILGSYLIGLLKNIPDAARAESSLGRLTNQLSLLGQASKTNIASIEEFGKKTAASTRFSAEEVNAAVTIALRKTGDVNKAIKQVAVSQDVAAATGRDLVSVTQLLNVAQSGHSRVLRQITNLSELQIATAIRQGTIMDVLAKKFGGSAAKEANTLAVKLAILGNVQEQYREETGKLGLAVTKVWTDIRIGFATAQLAIVRNLPKLINPVEQFKNSMRLAKDATSDWKLTLSDTVNGLINLVNPLNAVVVGLRGIKKEATQAGSVFGMAFNFDKAMESEKAFRKFQAQTVDERRQIERDYIRMQDAIVVAEQQGSEAISNEQKKLLNSSETFRRRMEAIVQGEVDDREKANRTLKNKYDELAAKRKPTGKGAAVAEFADLAAQLLRTNDGAKLLASELTRTRGITGQVADDMMRSADAVSKTTESYKEFQSLLKKASSEQKGNVNTLLEGARQTILEVTKKLETPINIKFDLSPEAIKVKLHELVSAAIENYMRKAIDTQGAVASRERKAAASAS